MILKESDKLSNMKKSTGDLIIVVILPPKPAVELGHG